MKRPDFIRELVKHGFTYSEARELVNDTENISVNEMRDHILKLLETAEGEERKALEKIILEWPGSEAKH